MILCIKFKYIFKLFDANIIVYSSIFVNNDELI